MRCCSKKTALFKVAKKKHSCTHYFFNRKSDTMYVMLLHRALITVHIQIGIQTKQLLKPIGYIRIRCRLNCLVYVISNGLPLLDSMEESKPVLLRVNRIYIRVVCYSIFLQKFVTELRKALKFDPKTKKKHDFDRIFFWKVMRFWKI